MSEHLKRLLASSPFWVASGLVVGAILEFTFRAVSARLLGPEAFGQLTFLSTLLLVMGSMATLGMGNVIPRYLPMFQAEDGSHVSQLLAWALRVCLIGSGLFGLLLWGTDRAGIWVGDGIWMVAILLPLYVLSELAYATNRGLHRTKQAMAQREVLRRGVPLVLLLLAFWFPQLNDLRYFMLVIGVGLVVAVIYGSSIIWHSAATKVTDLPLHQIIVYALPLVFSTVLMQLNARMDIFIAASRLNAQELGLYSASLVLPQLLAMLPGVFTFSLLPRSAKSFKEGNLQDVRGQLLRVTVILFVVAIGPACALWVGGAWWVEQIFGSEYHTDLMLVELLTMANFLMALCGGFGVTLLALGRTKVYLLSDILAVLVGGLTQWSLVGYFGLMGLAVGVLVTVVLVVFIRGMAVQHVLLAR